MLFLVSARKDLDLCTGLHIWRGSSTPYLVDALIPIIFAVVGHAKCLVSSDAIEREKHRLPEMLDDIAEELEPMPQTSPLSLLLVARGDRTCSQRHQRDHERLSVCDGGVFCGTSHLDSTITSPTFAYLCKVPTLDDRICISPSSSKRWRTEDEVLSAAPLLTAAAAIALVRRLIEASYPMLRSHHGRVRV
jgi:hypothetical protein